MQFLSGPVFTTEAGMVSLLLLVIFLCGMGFALHAWRQHRRANLQSDQVGLVEDYYNYYDGYHTMK